MAIIGIHDLKANGLPDNWVLPEMKRLQLQAGVSIEEVTSELQMVVQETSLEILRDENYAGLFAIQDSVEIEYHIGDDDDIEELTEHGIPGVSTTDTTGHSIPIRPYGRGVGFTYMALPKMRRSQIEAQMRGTVTKIRNHLQRGPLQRLFKMEAESVGAQSGASVPLADGGVSDTTYIPPNSHEGETFQGTHDHFIRVAAITDANINLHVDHLREHGHEPPYNIIAARSDVTTWLGLSGFKKPEWAGLIYHANPDIRAAISDQQSYVGYYESESGVCRVWLTPRLPSNYYNIHKTYGAGNPQNPVRMRIDPLYGYGYRIVPGMWANSPQHVVIYQSDHGWGVGQDRTNGVCVYVAGAGDYVSPSIL